MSNRRRQALITVAWGLLITLCLATGLAIHRLWTFRAEIETLANRLSLNVGPESTLLYDSNNNLISALFEQHRIAVRLEEMSPHLIRAVLVTEDRRFFDHDGVDLRRIVAAFIVNQRAGQIVEGGSTITQQLVRSILLDNDRNYTRKFKEAVLARRLEEKYAKRAILEAYLNRVYFGDGYYGVEAASIGYFGKPVGKLDVAEAATLAGLIKGPSVYAPTKDPNASKKRRNIVLALMHARRHAERRGVPGRQHGAGQRLAFAARAHRRGRPTSRAGRRIFPGSGFPRAGAEIWLRGGLHRRTSRLHDARSRSADRCRRGDSDPPSWTRT